MTLERDPAVDHQGPQGVLSKRLTGYSEIQNEFYEIVRESFLEKLKGFSTIPQLHQDRFPTLLERCRGSHSP